MNKFIVGIVIISVTLIIGLFIAAAIQDATYESTTNTVINETGAYLNATGYTVTNSGALNGIYSVAEVFNYTDGTLIDANRYSMTSSGILTNTTEINWDNVTVSYVYTYDSDSATSNASANLVTSLAGGTSWITILVVVGFATIVLGMLTTGFGRTAEEESTLVY